jgi:hypothetical protein
MDPITLVASSVACMALIKSFSGIFSSLSKHLGSRSVKIEIKTQDGRMVRIEGDLTNPEEIERLMVALKGITPDAPDKQDEIEGRVKL